MRGHLGYRRNWILPRRAIALAGALVLALAARAPAVTFSFTFDGSVSADMQAGMLAAAALWEAELANPVTVRVNVSAADLGPGVLGGAASYQGTVSYATYRDALIAGATSATDASVVAALQSGPALSFLINRTSDSPHGAGSATPYLDADGSDNNTTLRLNTALAHAVGLFGGYSGPDAEVQFSTSFPFDFDRSNGIGGGLYDFIGVAAHELGHVLGFTSGVDVLDTSPGGTANSYLNVTPMDLFRFSLLSYTEGPGIFDFTADTRDKYFSIDGGVTLLEPFSTGRHYGDGQQASHWKDNLGIGLLDPTAAAGEQIDLTAADLRLMDAIGWNLSGGGGGGGVPEPALLSLLAAAALALHATTRRW